MKKQKNKEWFENESFWIEMYPYLFSEKRFAEAFDQVDKIIKLLKLKKGSVLDLCCGPGRCSIAFAKRGFFVTGVDRNKYFLDKGKAKASVNAKKSTVTPWQTLGKWRLGER